MKYIEIRSFDYFRLSFCWSGEGVGGRGLCVGGVQLTFRPLDGSTRRLRRYLRCPLCDFCAFLVYFFPIDLNEFRFLEFNRLSLFWFLNFLISIYFSNRFEFIRFELISLWINSIIIVLIFWIFLIFELYLLFELIWIHFDLNSFDYCHCFDFGIFLLLNIFQVFTFFDISAARWQHDFRILLFELIWIHFDLNSFDCCFDFLIFELILTQVFTFFWHFGR